MSAKLAGSIKASQRKVGKLYRSFGSQQCISHLTFSKSNVSQSRKCSHLSSSKKRSNSVGKIIRTNQFDRKLTVKKVESPRRGFHQLINYDQIEQKLSNHLEETIRSNSRQKCNYLSKHYNTMAMECSPYDKLQYFRDDLRPKNNILQLSQTQNRNNIETKVATISQKTINMVDNQILKIESSMPYLKKERSKSLMSNKENIDCIARSIYQKQLKFKKQTKICEFLINHRQHKNLLQSKLTKIIDNYQAKNKQLSLEMEKLENTSHFHKVMKPEPKQIKNFQLNIKPKKQLISQEQVYSIEFLSNIFSKLVEYNIKGMCMNNECNLKLQQLWKAIYSQILLDEKVRIVKIFIKQNTISNVLEVINFNRIKKLQMNVLKIHTEEYDPFLIEKQSELFKTSSPNLNTKKVIKWIADTFVKFYQQAQHHWLKYLSQQKIQCSVRTMILQKEIIGLRKNQGCSKNLTIKDFTRQLSTLFKANLRNRNVYQIYIKIKDMPYVERFIELLQEKAVKGSDLRKFYSQK